MRTFKKTATTKYYKQNLLATGFVAGNNRLYTLRQDHFDGVEYTYYYGNSDEVAKLPRYVGLTLDAENMIPTHVEGPYIFYNGFDQEKDAQKLLKLTSTLYPTDKELKEIAKLLKKYDTWVSIIPSMTAWMDALKSNATRLWTNVDRVRIANS